METSGGICEISHAPANANGTDPTHSQATSFRFTVPCRRWTNAPTGFMNRLTTMSLETAVKRVDAEEEDQHRRHQRPAAHPREPDDRADEEPADRERDVEGHAVGRVG